MTNTLLRLASCLAVLISGCGGGQDAPQDAHPNHVWQGSAANLQLDMFYSAANAVLSDVPLASFNYQVVPTPNVAIENWLPTLVTLPAQRARCVPEGPVHVLSVYEGNVLQYYVDENHAACALPAETCRRCKICWHRMNKRRHSVRPRPLLALKHATRRCPRSPRASTAAFTQRLMLSCPTRSLRMCALMST